MKENRKLHTKHFPNKLGTRSYNDDIKVISLFPLTALAGVANGGNLFLIIKR